MAVKNNTPKHVLPEAPLLTFGAESLDFDLSSLPDRITPVSASISFAIPALTEADSDRLRAWAPGVTLQKKRNTEYLTVRVPNHAFDLILPYFASTQTAILTTPVNPRPGVYPGAPVGLASWDRVSQVLAHNGEIKSSYITDFILDYQKEAVCFAAPRVGSLFHHPTGSGKTFASIVWALLYPGAILIVTRAPTREQYARQVERFTYLRPFVCKPTNEIRKRDKWKTLEEYMAWTKESGQRPVLVVGWEALPDWATRLLAIAPNTVIFDESHTGRNKKRVESVVLPPRNAANRKEVEKKIKAQGGSIKIGEEEDDDVGFIPLENVSYYASLISRKALRRLATTATPIPDRVRGLWAQLDLLEPYCWGSHRFFALRYCDGKPGQYGGFDDAGSSNLLELSYRLQYIKHYVSSDVSRQNLPPKRREAWYIPPSQQVKTTGWKSQWKKAQASGAESQLELALEMAAAAKRPAVVARMMEHVESGHKIVGFTGRRKDCEELAEAVRSKDPSLQVWCGHGGQSQTERTKMLEEYAAHPGPCVLIGTWQTLGTGVDGLQCTDAAFFVLLPWDPGTLDQGEGRFTRHGQLRPVVIYYPIAERTADERIADILLNKLPAVEKLAADPSLAGAAEILMGKIEDTEVFARSVLVGLDDNNDDLWV